MRSALREMYARCDAQDLSDRELVLARRRDAQHRLIYTMSGRRLGDRLALDVVPELDREVIPVKLLAIPGGARGSRLMGVGAAVSVGTATAGTAPAIPAHVAKVVAGGDEKRENQRYRKKHSHRRCA